MNLPIASSYLQHLNLLSQEEKARFLHVPPFTALLALAAFTHIALLSPLLFADVSEELPRPKQVRLAFGIDKDAQKNQQDNPAATPKPELPIAKPITTQAKKAPVKLRTIIPTKTPQNIEKIETSIEELPAPPVREMRNVMTKPSNASLANLRQSSGGYRANAPRSVNAQASISKYEQLLSGWINSHRLNKVITLPAGANGRVVLRLRINRRGYVIFKTVEQSSGVAELDQAAIDSVTRASPVPAVPEEYPGGAQLEFLIPINFIVN